jgi:hypothetical protein
MTNSTANKPVQQLRDGAIRAAIWANQGQENRTFYSVTISRTYKEGEEYRDSNSFSGADLLKLSRIAAKAYDAIAELRAGRDEPENGASE